MHHTLWHVGSEDVMFLPCSMVVEETKLASDTSKKSSPRPAPWLRNRGYSLRKTAVSAVFSGAPKWKKGPTLQSKARACISEKLVPQILSTKQVQPRWHIETTSTGFLVWISKQDKPIACLSLCVCAATTVPPWTNDKHTVKAGNIKNLQLCAKNCHYRLTLIVIVYIYI